MRYTEYHADKAVIKDKSLLPDAMEKLAKVENLEETGCEGCRYKLCVKQLLPCRLCKRDKEDKFERVVQRLEESRKELQKGYLGSAFYRMDELNRAIKIVKEECGISE